MKNFLHELYYKQVSQLDNNTNMNNPKLDALDDLDKKIMRERKYFASSLSPDSYKRFKNLGKLHTVRNAIRDKHICANAFRLGVLHICAVLFGEEEEIDDEF